MNEVDRTGEGITSLLYVYTFLSFVSADLSKKIQILNIFHPTHLSKISQLSWNKMQVFL